MPISNPTLNQELHGDVFLIDGTVLMVGIDSITSELVDTDMVVTVNTTTAHGLTTGDPVTITGADQADYNVALQAVTVVDANTFTFIIAGAPASPATGDIKCQKGWEMDIASYDDVNRKMVVIFYLFPPDVTVNFSGGDFPFLMAFYNFSASPVDFTVGGYLGEGAVSSPQTMNTGDARACIVSVPNGWLHPL